MKFIMIEDHSLVRQGVSKIIEEKSDFCCAGTFATVSESKEFLKEFCKSFDHEPLICIIDINLGDDNGLSLIRFIKESSPSPEEVLIGEELEEKLLSKIKDKLTDLEEQVFTLLISGFKYKEIAEILDKDGKSIDNAIQRIKVKIKNVLKED